MPPFQRSAGGKLINAPIAASVLAHLISDDPQDRQLAHGELAGERRWHRTRGGKVPATGDRDGALGSPLRPPGWADRRAPYRDAHRLDLAADDAPTRVQALGQALGIIVGHSTSREALPDRAGQVIEAGERAR